MSEKTKKKVLYIVYTLIVVLVMALLSWLGHFEAIRDFLTRVESASFDNRQKVVAKYKKPNKDIKVIALDDESYEYIMDRYGSWPVSRGLWADVLNGVEKAKPNKIIMDLIFTKPTNDTLGDTRLVETIKNNKNIYISANFDNTSQEVRTPKKLDNKFKLNVIGEKLKSNDYITYSNVRFVMDELAKSTSKVGIINVSRDEDGVIRNATPIFEYQDKNYPNLTLLAALDILGKKQVMIMDNKIIIDENHIIPLDNTSRTILNWYGGEQTYEYVSFWKVVKAIKENNQKFLDDNFNNKIIYIGTTATSLSDIKTVPTASLIAGVELHCTFLNNILDNNFIKKLPLKVDFLIAIILSLMVGFYVLREDSIFKTFLFLFLTMGVYALIATFLMACFNYWVSLIIPFSAIIMTFILIYCEKYLLKVKDYEKTYKLAVTDGLTQLYNHRYFQEQMIVQLNNYKRYQTPFSLIMIDIDFFKKFNDTYGHQSGDAVLKQVANILKKNSRTSDIACRYGGEEMTVILTNTSNEPAVFMANKLCQIVRETKFVLVNNEKVNVTISVGVATINDKVEKPQELIEYCDKCLYKAKENGRNQVVSTV